MSDHPSVARGLGLRLRSCGGPPGCPCESSSASVASSHGDSPSASMEGSRSRSHGDSGSDHSTADSSRRSSSGPAPSDSGVPDGEPTQEWSGLSRVAVGKCDCGKRAVMKKCTRGEDCGRRFLGCGVEDEMRQCQFKEWLDAPWPKRAQESLKKLSKELQTALRCESTANASLIEALQIKQVAFDANKNLVKKVKKTKKKCHLICQHYYNKAGFIVKQRSSLLKLVYWLMAAIAILVAVLFYYVQK